MTRIPARAVAGNRIWTHDGSVWAIWRVDLPSYPLLSDDGKLTLHARVREALGTLPRRAQLLGVHRRIAPSEVAARVVAGVPAAAVQRWRRAAREDARALVATGPVERRVYLLAQVVEPKASTIIQSATATVAATLGLPASPPPLADQQTARLRAQALGTRLGRTLTVRPVGAAELSWLYRRAVLRGVHDPPPPDEELAGGERRGGGDRDGTTADGEPAPRAVPPGTADAVLFEGGQSGDPGRGRHRRYVRVDTDHGTSFQATLAIAEMPPVFRYPGGGEWFAVADMAPFGIDWFARLEAVPNVQAQTRARRQQRQLNAQVAEYDGEPAGPPQTLAEALEGIGDEQAALAANPGDPELEVTIGFTVWGADVAEVDARAARLADLLEPWGYGLHRPTGGQVAMLSAGLPAAPVPGVCADYLQFLLPRDLAAGAPFAGAAVGDPQGIPLGVSVASGMPEAVLLDPAHGPATNRSGSMGVFGALGSGKSFFVKRVVLGTIARGGQVVTLDRTTSGEYAHLAEVVTGAARVVRLDEHAGVGLDPLQVFEGEDRVRIALGFLSILTRTTPAEVDGAVLSAAVRHAAMSGGTLVDVAERLEASEEPEAHPLRRKLHAYRDHPLASLVFGDRPPLRLDADLICFHAPGLSLPDRDAMVHEHLARQLLPEQVFSQALLYLVAAVARTITFADARRFGAVLVDEAWALTASPQGRQLLLDTVRDGRKHNAAVWLLSQHPDDLGDDALSHLLGIRAIFRQSRGAAPAALRFAGVEPTDDMVELVTTGLQTGQCLLRDVADRLGLVQVLPPASPTVRRALDTTPSTGEGGTVDGPPAGRSPGAEAAPGRGRPGAARGLVA